ncbi:hypothetical protein PF010_g16132 [Phytophthora fragariae]|nr:hypothetical protein PF003_g35704 [Phytophthora fragariae]KAE8944128.1 hypothetical protein PF009_g6184 [Phytophthora fragariae]KAE9017653.1 hypothetical protein PF011_g6612 [Phytophthora fragariae]KAE9096995.1 hypothetical protein PF010_g16132 [Phytophthora fragariae]KAE9109412.1 hypothetical protein PF007_g12249 [Phytophthora fragariae]
MAQFKPKRWQVEDQCGLCAVPFTLMNARHHCRHCGVSVCGKHSKNRVIVPTSLSKVPQRVCDKCYPKCRNVARGLPPPPSRDLPDDVPRRHTLEKDYGHRMRSPREGARRPLDGARRDNRTWNGDADYDEPRRLMRKDVDPRAIHAAHERRMRSPRAKSPHGKEKPSRDGDLRPKERGDTRDKERRNRDPREHDSRESERERERRHRDPREKERRERDPREKERRERDPREKERRDRDHREERRDRDPRDKERRDRDPRDKERRDRDLHKRDPSERERRDRDPRERDRRDRALRERDLFEKPPRERSSRESPGQKERHRIPSTEPVKNRRNEHMRSPAPSVVKRVSDKMREETPSTCRTTSSTLSNLYAAINASEEVKTEVKVPPAPPKRPPPRKKEKPSAFEDSTFSIFSLAGSDHAEPEPKAANARVVKKKEARRPGKGRVQESMEKKEHLDFSASSSSVKSFEVSAITQKYLNPKPVKAAMQKTTLKPMIEEDSESEESTRGPRRRTAAPEKHVSERRRDAAKLGQRQHDKQVRGEAHKMLPPFRHGKTADASNKRLRGRAGSGALADGRKPSSQNSGGMSSRTSSISDDDYDEFKATQFSLSSDNFFNADDECFSNDEDEALAKRIAASNREKKDQAAKLRAKKAAIAGIDPASLEAKEKAPTTANYKLTDGDQEIMRQIAELEAIVLQHQKELPDLLDMYSEASKRAEKAQKELQKAKARVARYEKAHATVARAIRSGRLYMKQKEYMAAILELSRAIGIERSNATLWYMLAECRLKVGQPAAAEEACMTSLKQQPTGAGVALLGHILHERGRHDEAIECYLSALGRNDESEGDEGSE